MLFMLFQPQRALTPLFALLRAGLNATSAGGRVRAIGIQALVKFPLGAIVGALPGFIVYWYAWGFGALLAILFAIIGAFAGAAVGAILCLGRELPTNYFGLCNGMPGTAGEGQAQEPLTSWLHHYLSRLAGKLSEEPLTFGELWAGPLRIQGQLWDRPSDSAPRVIDLAMITTSLNLGRPFRLPFGLWRILGRRKATGVYFSDGGICSNFPIQFFDSALPTCPTFGVDLRTLHPDHLDERVWMPGPMENREGIQTYCPPMSNARTLGSGV